MDARRALESPPPGVSDAALARAREEMFIAEGSDWFWWYGDDHSSDHDREFDELFRRHVQNVYRALGLPVPGELLVTNITTQPPDVEEVLQTVGTLVVGEAVRRLEPDLEMTVPGTSSPNWCHAAPSSLLLRSAESSSA